MLGKIKWYNPEKSFGFITTDSGKDYFLHKTEFNGVHTELDKGVVVEFKSVKGRKGLAAVNVSIPKLEVDNSEDSRIICPSCKRKVKPMIRYQQGVIVGSTCPYCLASVKKKGVGELANALLKSYLYVIVYVLLPLLVLVKLFG